MLQMTNVTLTKGKYIYFEDLKSPMSYHNITFTFYLCSWLPFPIWPSALFLCCWYVFQYSSLLWRWELHARRSKLPVPLPLCCYNKAQFTLSSAWMTKTTILLWFNSTFIPYCFEQEVRSKTSVRLHTQNPSTDNTFFFSSCYLPKEMVRFFLYFFVIIFK